MNSIMEILHLGTVFTLLKLLLLDDMIYKRFVQRHYIVRKSDRIERSYLTSRCIWNDTRNEGHDASSFTTHPR